MGHSAAPEFMHAVTSILAGHPAFVLPEFAAPADVSVDVWIDNIRWSGSAAAVAVASRAADELAVATNVTWKPSDTRDCVTEYEFIGGAFNHDLHRVALSGKNATRLPEVMPGVLTFADLEVLVGRLIFAAGLMCIPLASVWWPMKWARRRYHDYNHVRLDLLQRIDVPAGVRRRFQWWLDRAHRSYTVPAVRDDTQATLFTDASLGGWGATLVTSKQEVFIAAGAWEKEFASGDISFLEGRALSLGVDRLADAFARSGDAALQILVDNTSVQAAVRRGTGRAWRVSEAARPGIEALHKMGVPVSVDYIASADNPADGLSRGLAFSEAGQAVRMADERRGGGRGARWCAPVCRVPQSLSSVQ